MKVLIALIFLAPALASAQLNPIQENLIITSGTGTVDFTMEGGAIFNVSGSNFSLSGDIGFPVGNPENMPEPLGGGPPLLGGDTSDWLNIGLVYKGVPYYATGLPDGGGAYAILANGCVIRGLGSCSGTFFFTGIYGGTLSESAECDPCAGTFTFYGQGTVTGTVIPYPNQEQFPGTFLVEHETLTFTTPEPSTASLLGIAAVGLALSRRRRISTHAQHEEIAMLA